MPPLVSDSSQEKLALFEGGCRSMGPIDVKGVGFGFIVPLK